MDFELYKKIIEECRRNGVYSIKLSWRGEVLLHPKIVEMVKYAKERGIKDVGFLTNGGLLDKKLSEQLIDAKLDWISISFDGLGGKYESIRYPLKYEETLGKIRDLKRQPIMSLQLEKISTMLFHLLLIITRTVLIKD